MLISNSSVFTYQAGSGVALSKKEILRCLLEGTAASDVDSIVDEEKDATGKSGYSSSAGRLPSNFFSHFIFQVTSTDIYIILFFRYIYMY